MAAPADASAAAAAATATPAGNAAAAVGAAVVAEQTAGMQSHSQAIKQAASSSAEWGVCPRLALPPQHAASQAALACCRLLVLCYIEHMRQHPHSVSDLAIICILLF